MYWALVATVLWLCLAAGLGLGIWGLTSKRAAVALRADADGGIRPPAAWVDGGQQGRRAIPVRDF